MKISISKKLLDLDCGLLGKKNLQIDATFSQNQDGSYSVTSWHAYSIEKDGKLSSLSHGELVDKVFATKVFEQALEEFKTIKLNFNYR